MNCVNDKTYFLRVNNGNGTTLFYSGGRCCWQERLLEHHCELLNTNPDTLLTILIGAPRQCGLSYYVNSLRELYPDRQIVFYEREKPKPHSVSHNAVLIFHESFCHYSGRSIPSKITEHVRITEEIITENEFEE